CRIAWTSNLEAGGPEKVDQELRLAHAVRADPADPDLLDQVVARRRGVERGNVRSAGEESRRAGRILELRLECKRPRVRLPARECRLEGVGEIRTDIEPAVPGPAAEPLDTAADREVHVQRGDVQRHDPGRLIRVEN